MSIRVARSRKIWSLLILSIFSFYHLYAYQTNSTKDEKNFILYEKDQAKVNNFLLKIYSENPSIAKEYYQLYLKRGLQDNNNDIQFRAHYYLSDIAYENGNYPTAIYHGKSMLDISLNNKNSDQQVYALNQLGNIHYKLRKYEESLSYFIDANKIHKKNNPKDLQLGILGNINMIRTRIHRYQEALESYNNIISLLEKEEHKNSPNYWDHYVSLLLGKGVCHYHLKQYDLALGNYEKGQELARKHNLKKKEVIFDMTIGETYTAKEMYAEALDHLYKANTSLKSSNTSFNSELHTSYFHLATVFYKNNDYQKALDYLSESFEVIEKEQSEGQVEKINEMYDLAYKAAKKLDRTALIIKYSEGYRRVIDSFHLDDIKTKDRLYDQDLSELEEKNENLSSQNLVYILISIIFILVIIGLLIYNLKRQRKNKKIFEELQQKQQPKPRPKTIKKEFVTDEKANVLLQKLNELEKTNFFLDLDCNLYNTAKLIDTNTTYLSKIINEHQQKSFNEYINSLRINYGIKQLETNKKFRSYTIKGIASELGYKSVNTFASAFKKQTGISHSYYIKQILKRETTVHQEV